MNFRFSFIALFLFSILSFQIQAQVPQGINYQAVARNASGSVVVNQSFNVKASVISGTSTGTTQWEETHAITTNQFGLFTIVIGQGTRTGGAQTNFSDINWATENYYLKIETDISGSYTDMGTTQLVSVPYALLAEKTVTQPALGDLTDVSTSGATSGQVLKYNGTSWAPANDNTGSGGSSYTAGTGININGSNVISTTNLGGDVTGSTPSTTVKKIQGVDVAASAPTDGQVLKYNSANSRWQPSNDNNTSYTTGNGIGISGNTITNTAPDQPVTLTGTGGTTVTGSYPNFTINSSSSGNTYTAGTGININGSNVISTTNLGGDVTGTLPANTVTKIQGRSIAATAPTNGQVLQYNASSSKWEPATISTAGSNVTATTAYNTTQLAITPATLYTLIPGLTQTINLPLNATVIVSTYGGAQSLGATATSFSALNIAIGLDGNYLPTGGTQFMLIANTPVGQNIGNWSMTQSFVVDGTLITAGSHTIEVLAQFDDGLWQSPNAVGANIGSSLDPNSVLKSALTITVIKN